MNSVNTFGRKPSLAVRAGVGFGVVVALLILGVSLAGLVIAKPEPWQAVHGKAVNGELTACYQEQDKVVCP